ncbi:D-glycero-alpha-D-manno-heptose 1-phosphate guanylyltransferase [Gimesia panareensis]|uniref:D-glycero-alpha-D-manno-heptose 1-phosphate guanylyltransferase n=1 Tax=Gimesia panareensis TaxID=2527978 RepID=A0A518FM08_9PLAN|nr:nucleotidyltransferase family protein [Gimesia panareensis]QDV17396.1 D-glycero-alpha-D-manno-heptose 1-phosphate guanylyltransferase [Gimesia panareensis]
MNDCLISATADITEAIRAIEAGKKGIAVIVDSGQQLQGVITDGDVRRGLLSGLRLQDSATQIMNRRPTKADAGMSQASLVELLESSGLEAMPLVNADNQVVEVVLLSGLTRKSDTGHASGFSCALIMAGGEGRRLLPLTENLPKPLVEVGGMPLIERQVRRLATAGVERIYIAVNYLAEMIEAHLGDGSRFGTEIQYLREREKLGTAGALSLIEETPTGPLLLMNGDVFTSINYQSLLDFHQKHAAVLTVAAIDYHVEIPYGVIKTEGPFAVRLEEKPSQQFLCNAGIYALSPEAVSQVPRNQPFNMTDLIESNLTSEPGVAVFPVHEYWSDIGTPAELDKARTELKLARETLEGTDQDDESAVHIQLNQRRAA